MRVFDSNILIYHLNDQLPLAVRAQVDDWIQDGVSISVITRIEILGYRHTADSMLQAMRLLATLDEVPLHEAVVQQTITLRQQHRIRLPDAVIAATALHLGFPLVTRNEQDFQGIDGLTVVNPFP